MNKIFLFEKHAKSGEDCNKFSRSVSYETLVGGTTTVGGDYKQTQCLSKVCAGYRFCKTMRFSYENLVDRLLQTSPILKKVCKSRRKCLIGSINLIRRSLEFFAFAKNRDDSFFVASPRDLFHRHSEPQAKNPVKHTFQDWILHLASAQFRMTISTLTLAVILAMGIISESWAVSCTWEGTKLTVTGIGGEKFTGCPYDSHKSATEVTFGEGITSIGDHAFMNASSLQRVDMPNVTSIGNGAFYMASSLQSVDMPNVTSIGDSAFSRATSLQSVDMPKATSIRDWAFYEAHSINSITISDAASTGWYSFGTGNTLTDVNCIENPSTENTCANVKTLMKSKGASFSDSQFYIITEPTANCGGYSQGVCSTCASGYSVIEGSCARECNETEYRQGSGCISRSVGCSEGYMLENITCISQTVGCSSGYLNKDNTECIEPSACGGEYIADEAKGVCKKMPGCVDFANGACGGCETGFYKKEGGCVAATDGCGDGYLKKGTSCISAAQGCGSSFRLNDGECDRIRYTPAEAAQYLKDTDNEIIMTFKVNR